MSDPEQPMRAVCADKENQYFKNGELRNWGEKVTPAPLITVDPTLGPYCSESRLQQCVDIAKELQEVSGIGPLKVWYDSGDDFVKIEFELDGHHFLVRAYKIFAVSCDHPPNGKYDARFSISCRLVDFFLRGKYKRFGWNINDG